MTPLWLPLSKKGLYWVCSPDNISSNDLIQRFIAFVDANTNYTLASTAVQAMLGPDYGSCKKNASRRFPPRPLSVVPAVKGLDRKQRLDMNKNGLDIYGQACRHANVGAGRDIRGSRRSLRSQQEWIDSGPWYARLILACGSQDEDPRRLQSVETIPFPRCELVVVEQVGLPDIC